MTIACARGSWEAGLAACALVALGAGLLQGCNEAPVAAGAAPVHLEARSGAGPGALVLASYQRKAGAAAELEIQVEGAPPGATHVVTLDGRELGKLVTDPEGEGELELGPEGRAFPADFAEPKAGSVLRIGELSELRLSPLERLVHLEAEIDAGGLEGKASFKLELLAGETTREFKLKLAGAPRDTPQPVRLDGVAIGTLAVGSDGEGKLEYSEVERLAFPAGFPEPKAGAVLEIGQLFRGALEARE